MEFSHHYCHDSHLCFSRCGMSEGLLGDILLFLGSSLSESLSCSAAERPAGGSQALLVSVMELTWFHTIIVSGFYLILTESFLHTNFNLKSLLFVFFHLVLSLMCFCSTNIFTCYREVKWNRNMKQITEVDIQQLTYMSWSEMTNWVLRGDSRDLAFQFDSVRILWEQRGRNSLCVFIYVPFYQWQILFNYLIKISIYSKVFTIWIRAFVLNSVSVPCLIAT